TWEPRQMIEDLGHVKLLDAFDHNHRSDRQGVTAAVSSMSPISAARMTKSQKNAYPAMFGPGMLESFIGSHVIVSSLVQAGISARVRLERIAAILSSPAVEQKFFRLWQENFGKTSPRVAYSRIDIAHIGTGDQLRNILPVTTREARVRITIPPINSKRNEMQQFVAYVILAPTDVTRHRDLAVALSTYSKLKSLVENFPETVQHYGNGRYFDQYRASFAVPLWVVEGRAAFPQERMTSDEEPTSPRVVYSRIDIAHIRTGDQLRNILPVTTREARVRSTIPPINSKGNEMQQFVAYVILAPTDVTRHRDLAVALSTYSKLKSLVENFPETVQHYGNGRYFDQYPASFAVPLWVVEGRAAFPQERMTSDEEPCRVPLKDMLCGGNGKSSEDEAANVAPPSGKGVVKMMSGEGLVYYKHKREKRTAKPKHAARNQQSSLRLDKTR
ncbi:Hypothetical protein, putative, partial [Bodo saltans]